MRMIQTKPKNIRILINNEKFDEVAKDYEINEDMDPIWVDDQSEILMELNKLDETTRRVLIIYSELKSAIKVSCILGISPYTLSRIIKQTRPLFERYREPKYRKEDVC